MTKQQEQEVDWLVAGAGAAGMTGAVTAHELGGSVLVVEKELVYGGTTSKSGGVIWIPGNDDQAACGISDGPDEGYQYLHGLIGNTVTEARLRAFTTGGPEMLRFMTRHSHVDYSALPEYMDYYEHVPGYKEGGRSMDCAPIHLRELGAEADHIRIGHYDGLLLPFNVTVIEGRKLQEMDFGAYLTGFKLLLRYLLELPGNWKTKRDRRMTLGPALVARLRRSLMDRDIPLWLNTTITELLQDEHGRITGAVVKRDGQELRIRARRGVLLATGGFSQNAELRKEYQQAPIGRDWTAASPGATGDGIQLGLQVGADLDFMGSAWWSPTYRIPDGRVLALIAGKAYPGSIMVNGQGRRFTNEAQPYEDVVKDQYASESRGEQAIPCYLVFDHSFRSKYAIGHIKPGKVVDDSKIPEDYFSSGLLAKAETLEELAGKIGIDPVTLVETVTAFNEPARQGKDPLFGRGATIHDRYYADKTVEPNPSLGPVEKAPFYALRCEPGDLDTKGGLQCDEHGRVLTPAGSAIEGLYAAGNTSAAVMGDTYPGAGATIGSAMTFGYLAAKFAFGNNEENEI